VSIGYRGLLNWNVGLPFLPLANISGVSDCTPPDDTLPGIKAVANVFAWPFFTSTDIADVLLLLSFPLTYFKNLNLTP
jgi:hypothetical protein